MKMKRKTLFWTHNGVTKKIEDCTKEELVRAIYELYDDVERTFAEINYYKQVAFDTMESNNLQDT